MNATFRAMAIALVLAVYTTTTNGTNAQGTATGPSTSHSVDPTNPSEIWIGGINDPIYGPDPYPIDLDPTGPPWTKDVLDTPDGTVVSGTITIYETIQNVGTEPWDDWHEIAFSGGTLGGVWDSVLDLRVNGSSIAYTATITGGGSTLTLDNFSQPVLPGDVFEIDKTLTLIGTSAGNGGLLFRIAEYPTTNIPEPASGVLILLGLGLAVTTAPRRSRVAI